METGRRIHHSAIQTAVPIAKDCAGVKVPVSAKAVNAKLAGPARISSIFFMRPPWRKRGGAKPSWAAPSESFSFPIIGCYTIKEKLLYNVPSTGECLYYEGGDPMNFLTIHYFLTLVEERNFTRAAERLHVTQQTLSGHIAMIEREVGMKLFIRHVPLELTDGGEVFYRYARIFQRNELAFRRALSDVSGSESGVLRIGVAPARGEVLLPPLLEAFHRRYPRVRIVLCEMANAMIWKALEREEIDLALARWEEELPGVSLYPYQEEEIVLLLSADLYQRLPGTEEEKSRVLSVPQKELPVFLEPCDFLLNSEGDIAGRLARKLFREASFAPRVAAESEHMATMLRLCLRGLGAYFCPKNLAEAMLAPSDMQKLHQIAFTEGKYMISFACHESSHRWSMIENFLKIAGK